ncbi:YcaO-like family protein [Clostridium grantii]|uniref:Ribosomal protein S12 methylthiotransferase accessory factor n=1 Tax=Clostridium grantii DSM 8605 TaxID=1121316 RepID=A0A1M5VFN7_9CLOT|nr:YcaO-like family protein [Clostridium grantii]SHH74040.1 ribosomal protein S12 methylthiotransferase accessory factor [Clostridium grantii DSM 8605]
MKERQKMHFKSKNPEETVEYIQYILKQHQIEVEEEWKDESLANTYSLRLSIKNTNIGTNGKGLTKGYARASAYAEFLERFQNNLLSIYPRTRLSEDNIYYSYDEKLMEVKDVIEDNNELIKKLFKDRNIENANFDEKSDLLLRLHKAEYMLTKRQNIFITVPFYSKRKKGVNYLPYNIYASMYGSNGMCAGNTPQEAIIQGLSEIIERYVQKKIIQGQYSLPDIPIQYIEKFPEIYVRYKKLKSIEGFSFFLKDCSLGGKYPVAALVIVENNSGYFGVKLGCHPDFGVAMERALTEAAQGGNITDYCRRSKLDFSNNFVDNEVNITNTFKTGRGQYPYSLFKKEKSFEFIPVRDVSEMNDQSVLDYMINEVIGEEYDILIRDVSYLNFPSFHIIIPNMSEMGSGDNKGFDLVAGMTLVEYLINNPGEINEKNCPILLYVLYTVSRMDLNSSLSVLSGTLLHNDMIPGEEFNLGWLYMVVLCYVYQNNYEKASEKMNLFEDICSGRGVKIKPFFRAVNYYITGMLEMKSHEKTIEYLKLFFEEEICQKLDNIFCNPADVFKKSYIYHDVRIKEDCVKRGCCDYHLYQDLIRLMKKAQLKNMIQQERVGSYLCEIS